VLFKIHWFDLLNGHRPMLPFVQSRLLDSLLVKCHEHAEFAHINFFLQPLPLVHEPIPEHALHPSQHAGKKMQSLRDASCEGP
jgi:hypothetical protein